MSVSYLALRVYKKDKAYGVTLFLLIALQSYPFLYSYWYSRLAVVTDCQGMAQPPSGCLIGYPVTVHVHTSMPAGQLSGLVSVVAY
jgi:hypothetical protein